MRLIASFVILLTLSLAAPGCRRSGHSVPQAIVGAMLVDGTVRPPIPNAVVLIDRSRIRNAGPAGDIPIPDHYNRVEANGRFLFPADVTEPIRIGGEANLLLTTVNPAVDPDYLKKVTGQMEGGRWVQYPQ